MNARSLMDILKDLSQRSPFLDEFGNDLEMIGVNQPNWAGDYPVHLVAMSGDSTALLTLIANGADMANKGERGMTALHCASLKNHPNIVRILLNSGADPNARDDAGQTPIDLASLMGHSDIVRILSEK